MSDDAAEMDMSAFNTQLIEEFRANGGKVGGMFAGAPLLLLTTTGAKSGQPRTAPLVYTIDDGKWVIIASKGGRTDASGLVPQSPRPPGRHDRSRH